MKYRLAMAAHAKLALHALRHPAVSGLLSEPEWLAVRPPPLVPAAAVNGVLIGKVGRDVGADGGTNAATGVIDIADAVPLFHTHLGLAPMLEVALTQIDEHFASLEDPLAIVGCYHANEHFDDVELGPVARTIADHIARHCPEACALLVTTLPSPRCAFSTVPAMLASTEGSNSACHGSPDSAVAGRLQLDNKALAKALQEEGGAGAPVVQLFLKESGRGWRPAATKDAQLQLQSPDSGGELLGYVKEERYHRVLDFDDHLDDVTNDWLNPLLFA
eukprot:SM000149S01355  [mRNA]  locus=s149:290345:291991:- [translate_table: standard]